MGTVINSTAHGFVAGDAIAFADLQGGEPIVEGALYFVLAAGLTADEFQFSDVMDGAPFTYTTDITSGSVNPWPAYVPITAPEDVMAPPDSRHVTHTWPEAPGQPQNFIIAPGFKAIGAHWDSSAVPDLMFYEVRIAPDDGTGTAPATDQWQKVQTRANTVWIDDLVIGQLYYLEVRSVDTTGNVVTSGIDPTPVNYLAAPEAGWTDWERAAPLAVGAGDVAFNSVLTNILASNQIDAGSIQTGLMRLQVADTSMADGVEVWSGDPAAGGVRLAKWDETGLYIGDDAGGVPDDLSSATYVHLTDAGLSVYLNGVLQTAITPDGINASAITFGRLPGGHNLLLNSSFELADFAPAPSTKVWDVAADWTGTEVAQVNRTNGAGAVTIAATTY